MYAFEYERKEDCLVCSQKPQPLYAPTLFVRRDGSRRALAVLTRFVRFSGVLWLNAWMDSTIAADDTVGQVLDKITADPRCVTTTTTTTACFDLRAGHCVEASGAVHIRVCWMLRDAGFSSSNHLSAQMKRLSTCVSPLPSRGRRDLTSRSRRLSSSERGAH